MLERAKRLAATSTCRNKHGAIIVKGGSVIGVGVNTQRNHPNICSDPQHEASFHAEIMALRSLGVPPVGARIYVARVNNRFEEMFSAPCETCSEALKQAGITKIFYTIGN